MRWLALSLVAFAFGAARADDSIRITFRSGYPLPGRSSETSQILISHENDSEAAPETQGEIDGYFSTIQQTLNAAHTSAAWEPAISLHADTVKLEIALGRKQYTFETGYGQGGPEVALGASETDRRNLKALVEILRVTTERMSLRLLGTGR